MVTVINCHTSAPTPIPCSLSLVFLFFFDLNAHERAFLELGITPRELKGRWGLMLGGNKNIYRRFRMKLVEQANGWKSWLNARRNRANAKNKAMR